MKFENEAIWTNKPGNDGLLFFTQRIKEMLFLHTDNMYKSPVHNSHTLMKEYLKLSQLVEKEIISRNHLEAVYDELIDSFRKDIILRNKYGKEKINTIIEQLNSSSEKKRQQLIHYLFCKYSDYGKYCYEYLLTIVPQEKEKRKIEDALRCYIPYLISVGYSPQFIYHYNNKIFNSDINCENYLKVFLDRFDLKKNKYHVYFAFNKKSERFKKILSQRLGASFKKDKYSHKLKFDKDNYYIVKFETDALDSNGAIKNIINIVNVFVDCYSFLGDRKEEWFFNKALVVDDNEDINIINVENVIYPVSKDYSDEHIARVAETTVMTLLNNVDSTFLDIKRILEIHSSALNNKDKNGAFLNMWSILEIVGIQRRDSNKIDEIINNIISILENDYTNTVFNELRNYIKGNLSKEEYERIKKSVEGSNETIKIANIVILDEYEAKRKELIELLKKAPLIRGRIYTINEIFKRKNGFIRELNRYSKRVRWHLLRIYRIRNSIIHMGEKSDYIDIVGKHLHGYVDEVIFSIVVRLSYDYSLKTIGNVLIEEQTIMESIRKDYSKKETMESSDIQRLLDE